MGGGKHPPDPRDDRPQRDHRVCHWKRRLKNRGNQANQRGNDPDLELRGPGRSGQPRPHDHHQWKLRVRRSRSISHQHENLNGNSVSGRAGRIPVHLP